MWTFLTCLVRWISSYHLELFVRPGANPKTHPWICELSGGNALIVTKFVSRNEACFFLDNKFSNGSFLKYEISLQFRVMCSWLKVKTAVVWDMTPCNLVVGKRIEGTEYSIVVTYHTTWHDVPEFRLFVFFFHIILFGSIIRVIKSTRMKWGTGEVHTGFWVGIPVGKEIAWQI